MSDLSKKDVERILRYELKLVDLSLDIDRNMVDSLQAKHDFQYHSEPVIVFDANIFELFIDPHDERAPQASLHSTDWLSLSQLELEGAEGNPAANRSPNDRVPVLEPLSRPRRWLHLHVRMAFSRIRPTAD
ncbi:hypothetical protein MMA231_03992 (plasmid) [Asticcacaulis sp. MM231]|uniref:hypothetical protein n=1 Tax=Asticcacaulis sp. MM231 TaxID=3157666 RepID=UPI0032D5980C